MKILQASKYSSYLNHIYNRACDLLFIKTLSNGFCKKKISNSQVVRWNVWHLDIFPNKLTKMFFFKSSKQRQAFGGGDSLLLKSRETSTIWVMNLLIYL